MRKMRCKRSLLTKIAPFDPSRKSNYGFNHPPVAWIGGAVSPHLTQAAKGGRLIAPSIARKQNRSRPKVPLIRHLTLRQLQHDEIVTQFASAVFAALHVQFEIVSEQCDVQRQRPRLHGVRSESGADLPIVAY